MIIPDFVGFISLNPKLRLLIFSGNTKHWWKVKVVAGCKQ